MKKNIIEIAPLRLKSGVSEEQLFELSRSFCEALKREVGGLLKYSLTKDCAQDRWADFVWWDSMESAQRALEKAPQLPEFNAYCAILDDADCEVMYFEERI